MASPHFKVKVGQTGSAKEHGAYILRIGKHASRIHKGEVLEGVSWGNLPPWALGDPVRFFESSDSYERSKGTSYREFELALPRELTPQERRNLLDEFVANEIGGVHVWTYAIHCPRASDGLDQPHAHLMFSERRIDGINRDPDQYFKRWNSKNPEKGGCQKGFGSSPGKTQTREERVAEIKGLRFRWEVLVNQHLALAGSSVKICLQSNESQSLGPAEPKLGPREWRSVRGRRQEVQALRSARREKAMADQELSQTIPNPRAALSNEYAVADRRRLQKRLQAQGLATAVLTEAQKLEFRRRLLERQYHQKVEVELAALIRFVDLNSLPSGIKLKLKNQGLIIDRGTEIESTGRALAEEVAATISLARLKGWKALRVTGSEAYVDAIRMAAAEFSISVIQDPTSVARQMESHLAADPPPLSLGPQVDSDPDMGLPRPR